MGHAVNDRRFSTLTLTAQGIVYEDIGTSLLYAVRTWFHESHGIAFTIEDILRILSLTIWSLILVGTVRYIMFVMRARQ